jgi:hypothetical protein
VTAAGQNALGLEKIVNGDVSGARACFLAASKLGVSADNLKGDIDQAKLWLVFIDLANTSVNADVVSLFRDNFGFVGYPTDLKTLLGGTWLSEQWYGRSSSYKFAKLASAAGLDRVYFRGSFTASQDGLYYCCYDFATGKNLSANGTFTFSDSGTEISPCYARSSEEVSRASGEFTDYQGLDVDTSSLTAYKRLSGFADLANPEGLYPEVQLPSWASALGAFGKSSSMYPLYIIANIIDKNPSGANQIMDRVLSGVFGSNLDSAIASLKALGDVTITVPEAVISIGEGSDSSGGVEAEPVEEAVSADSRDVSADATALVITQSEVLAFAASLEFLKGTIQLVDSYSYAYPLSSFQSVLTEYCDSDAFSYSPDVDANGVPDAIQTTLTGIKGPLAYPGILADRKANLRPAARASFVSALTDLGSAADTISEKLKAGAYTAVLSADKAEEYAGYIDAYSDKIAEAKAAFADSAKSVAISLGEDMTVTAYPGKLFDSAVFEPSNVFEWDATNSRPVKYLSVYGSKAGTTSIMSYDEYAAAIAAAPEDYEVENFGVKLNAAKLKALYSEIEDLGDALYLPINGSGRKTISSKKSSKSYVPDYFYDWLIGYYSNSNDYSSSTED